MKKWNKVLLSAAMLNALVAPVVLTASQPAAYATSNTTEVTKWFTIGSTNVKTTIDSKLAAKGVNLTADQFINDLLPLMIPNGETLATDVSDFRMKYASTFDKLFGQDVTVDQLLLFLGALETEVQNNITLTEAMQAPDRSAYLDEKVTSAVEMLTAGTYSNLDGKLNAGLGIGLADLIEIRENVLASFKTSSYYHETIYDHVMNDLMINGVSAYMTGVIPPSDGTVDGYVNRLSSFYAAAFPETGDQLEALQLRTDVKNYLYASLHPSTGNNTGGGSVFTPSTPPADKPHYPTGTRVISNPAVTVTVVKDENGVEVTVVKVKQDDVQKALKANKDAKAFVIPVNAKNGKGKAELTVGLLDEASANNTANTFIVSANGATYNLPSNLINAADVAVGLGLTEEQASDATVSVNVTEKPADTVTKGKLLSKVVDFSITVTSGDQSYEISDFGSTYVGRSFDLNGTVDNKKTVGVIVNADGTLAPVPTEFVEVDGKKVAVLKRNGNSTYAVLENSVSFTDIDASWAKADIELLANKLLVNGYNDGSFNPAGNITRAEFVTLLARGLGFEQNAADASFSDVTADDWYAGYLQPIVDAGIVNGFEDGTFRANNNITRQDAVVMLTRAVEFLNLRGDVTAEQADSALANFSDNGQIASYAQEAVGVTTSLDIIHGNTDGTFNPTGTANRAEAVKMLENLLLKANFLSI